ncbi:hypothetical protein C8R43DRAFT_870220 [Mycena crocata]|nr:hypothetical protein C8R43DRAFT_870220 [Mycena crocata]
MEDVAPATSPVPAAHAYRIYQSATDIEYTPEHALQQGLKMVNKLTSTIQGLQLGTRRQEVWARDTMNLRNQGAPSTLIAVCGATGAGKSSILNAILDDNIVPTSGMRACTAVVTEISHHNKKTIDADVSFLSEAEWKAELKILLDDLVDEDGIVKRSTDLRSDAGVAWSKVHAVYPTISQERLVQMTPEEIIGKDPKIAKILGATKNIVAKDSKTFGAEIAKYIDSKDQKKKDKDKKEKRKEKDNTPALWPLIRQVNVRCRSQALATGCRLVDLPGTCDSHPFVTHSIAKTYMKKANCIWILAPITRAVDDQLAKDLLGEAFRTQLMMDGSYNDEAITFIATKCDDISCSEVIRALNLDDPQLEEIQEKIEELDDSTSEWKKKKAVADKLVKSLDKELKGIRAVHLEHKAHLKALEDGEPFVPQLTAKKSASKPKKAAVKSKKRKNNREGKKGSPKRRRSGSFASDDDEDDKMASSDEEDVSSSSDSDDESGRDSDDDEDKDSDNDDEKDSDDSDDAKDSDIESIDGAEEEEITQESVKQDIADTKKLLEDARARLNDARKGKKEAIDQLATLKKKVTAAQKEKNAYCSLKRSEFAINQLKEDFRSGLKDLDDAAAEERDPDNFDPSVSVRDYDAVDLPVFTCSSRDYVRIQKQVKGDGEPTCFSNIEDTGIPRLQDWCHRLTRTSRERTAKIFLKELSVFATSVRQYVAGIGEVTATDRASLRDKWESGDQEVGPAGEFTEEDPFAAILGTTALYTMSRSIPKVDRYGEAIGITPRLVAEFTKVVETNISRLKDHLRDGLEERCRVGALNAAEVAVTTSDEFASSMHWGSYRATLRRNGDYRRDLNVELVNPFTRNIAQAWQQVFEADIFSSLLSSTTACVNKLVDDVERSAAPGLKDRAKLQGESCLEEARVALDKTVQTVKETLNNEQKEVSRCLAPNVQEQLLDGYHEAMLEVGKGSVARQKASFRSYISDCKDDIFENSADVILDRLNAAAEAVGKTLESAMDNLAQKIEVNLAVLWESVEDNQTQVKVRSEVVTEVDHVLEQVQLLFAAEKNREQDEDIVMA